LLAYFLGHVAAWARELEREQRRRRRKGEKRCRHVASAENRQWLQKMIT
jgi:hypothetical protein